MKKLMKIIGVLVLFLLVMLLISPLWLGPVAGLVANSVVPRITGTEFSVEKIRINPYTGTLRVEKLRLANPKGYDAEDAVALDLLSVKFEPMSLFKDTIMVTDITLENPYVSSLDKDGTNNFDQIIANVNAGKTDKDKEEKAGGKKVMVEHLAITGTRVRHGLATLSIPQFSVEKIWIDTSTVSLSVEKLRLATSAIPKFSVEKILADYATGTLRVEKLQLANPEGYDAEDAVALDLLSVKIEPTSLATDTIVINDVTLENPYVSYLDKDGTNNFDQIIANVADTAAKEDEKAKEEKAEGAKEDAEGKKVIVEHLAIAGARVRYGLVTLPIPNIVLDGIGVKQGGLTVESIGLEIWEKIKASFLSVGGAIGGAVGDAAKMLGDGAAGLLDSVTGDDATTGTVKGAVDGVKQSTDTLINGAKNLFK